MDPFAQFMGFVNTHGFTLTTAAFILVAVVGFVGMERNARLEDRKQDRNDRKLVGDITVANYKQLSALNRDHRQLMRDHFIQAKELADAKNELALMQLARKQDEEDRRELLDKVEMLESRVTMLEKEVEKREIELQTYRGSRRTS